MMMNWKPASDELVRNLRRRLEHSPQRLVEDSVKTLPIPNDWRELTLFIFQTRSGRRVFVAEMDHPDYPRVYRASALPPNDDAKEIAKTMMTCIGELVSTINTDARFRRSIITLNGRSVR